MKRVLVWLPVALGICSALAAADSLPSARPEDEGISSARLETMHSFHRSVVESGRVNGVVTLVARHGQIVDWQAYGFQDLERHTPMRRDTILRIHSMTKPITAVAVMMLVEEGALGFDDKIETFIPALAHRKVCIGGTVGAPQLVDAKRPITVWHLLTHTSGLTYGSADPGASIPAQIQAQPGRDPLAAADLSEFIDRVAQLPLVHQPGDAWTYGISSDVLGCLVQVVSGQPFETFVTERILRPLGMNDTFFNVPAAKLDRVAEVCTFDEQSRRLRSAAESFGLPERGTSPSRFPSGGGGLHSTAGDYARFAQMLLNKGELDGVRLLGRKTVQAMLTNQLEHWDDPTHAYSESAGYGFGGAVEARSSGWKALSSRGAYGWSGWASTHFVVDPSEDLVLIYLSQHLPMDQHRLYPRIFDLFYQTLVD